MKLTMMSLVFILFLAACGQKATDQESNVGISGKGNYMQVQLSVPQQGLMGGTTTIQYNSKSYMIGTQTPQNLRNRLFNYSSGDHNISIQGNFGQESGIFPNPTTTFDVIHVTSIKN